MMDNSPTDGAGGKSYMKEGNIEGLALMESFKGLSLLTYVCKNCDSNMCSCNKVSRRMGTSEEDEKNPADTPMAIIGNPFQLVVKTLMVHQPPMCDHMMP